MPTITSTAQAPRVATETVDVSVVIPCLNESETIATCVIKARRSMERAGLRGEVVVADNGSVDGSPEIAATAGARVVHETRKGYGSAYLAGFAAARGRFIVMGDGDDTYDFDEVDKFVEPLQDGADMVMGSRLRGTIHKGAMPPLHRYVGNPVLTGILNLFYRSGVSDAHCGMRAFKRDALRSLDLRTSGMEFASEMVIRASKAGLKIDEIPIEYHPRRGESKLSTWSDGWRHLRFLLIHSPTHLFTIPGAVMGAIGLLAMIAVLTNLNLLGREWDLHAMIAGAMLVIAGSQAVALGLVARAYGVHHLGEHDPLFERDDGRFTLERGLLAGAALVLAGIVVGAVILVQWIDRGFGALGEEHLAVFSLTMVVVGIQVILTSFLLSIVALNKQ
jgi:glycosyltransferase involved in cell wall biosynthesis